MNKIKGRPDDLNNRLNKEIEIYDFLDQLEISYFQVDHEEASTMELCQNIELALEAPICKNLFLCNRQKTKFYLLLMPRTKPFKTKDISKQINSARLSFASDDDLMKYLNITPGSCTIFGLMYDSTNTVQLVIDEDVLKENMFGCHPMINTSTIAFSTKDLLEKVIPSLNRDFVSVIL